MPLAAEEQWEAREAEKARTRERRPTQSAMRERGSRESVARAREQARTRFEERAASMDPSLDPHRADPRTELSREELAAVNRQAQRLADDIPAGSSRAAIARQLAERVAGGDSVLSATIAVMEAMRAEPGVVQPIDSIDPWSYEATIQGEVTTLYAPASSTQQQVGLITDDSGTIKLTIWKASRQTVRLQEGDVVRVTTGKVGSYRGRATLAADSKTRLRVLERGDGPSRLRGREQSAGEHGGQSGQDVAWHRRVVADRPG